MASEAVKKQRALRRRMFGRTLIASVALFSALFVLMGAQLAMGRDPVVGAGRQPAAMAQVARPEEAGDIKSTAGRALGAVVGGILVDALEDDDEDDEEHGRALPFLPQGSGQPQSPAAPVQTGSS